MTDDRRQMTEKAELVEEWSIMSDCETENPPEGWESEGQFRI